MTIFYISGNLYYLFDFITLLGLKMFYESQSGKLHFVQGEEALWLENFQYTICGKMLQSKASLAHYDAKNVCKACQKKYAQDPELNKEVTRVIHD